MTKNKYDFNEIDGHPFLLLLCSQGDSILNEIRSNSFITIEEKTAAQATARCYEVNPDAVMIHISLFEREGLDAFTEMIELCDLQYTPILVVTPSIEIDDCKRYAFAQEILASSVDPGVQTAVLLKHLEKRKRLMSQILMDPLTNTMNHIFLEQEIEKQLNDMKRSHDRFSLVYIELDGLQAIRSAYGYKTGMELMKGLADFFKQSLRPADSIGRYREGFVLVLPRTYREDALKLCSRLTPMFQLITFAMAEGELSVSFSSRVVDVIDASQTVQHCLSLMPFLPEERNEDSKALVIDGREKETGGELKKLKIGIIDDDRLIRELLSLQLLDIGDEEYEIEIRSYTDGEVFFLDPWHRQNEQFLLIIDRIMPKMDGLEILQKIRTQYDRRRYLCIMLTSRDSESEIALAIQRGANDYLIKPFSLTELRARMKRLLKGSR